MASSDNAGQIIRDSIDRHMRLMEASVVSLFAAGWLVKEYRDDPEPNRSTTCVMHNTADEDILEVYALRGRVYTDIKKASGQRPA